MRWIRIQEPSGVSEARRRARRYAAGLGLPSTKVEHVAIVATEIGQNILRHGGGGRIIVQPFGPPGGERLLLLGLDHGPGIAKLDRMLKDGESTRQSAGTGLGAMLRLTDRLDIETGSGGTLVSAEFHMKSSSGEALIDDAGLRISHPSERRCGDAIGVRRAGNSLLYLVCDGLGHGAKAADAGVAARTAFLETAAADPAELLAAMNEALQGTRGAVASVVRIERDRGRLSYAGVGNITTLLVQGKRAKRLPVRDGLLGGTRSSPHAEEFEIDGNTTVIMHSDGIATLRGLEERTSLLHRSAPVLATRLLDEFTRGRDDASIVVSRMSPARTL